MDLLPKTHKDFSSAKYWESFFKKRGTEAFEWYGEYNELCGILHKYLKPTDNILVIGCGNSTLSADLYDVGHKKIMNIDISDVVIRQMTEKHATQRPDLKYLKMDMMKMEFADTEYSVVLDKGTLDALMTDDSPEVSHQVDCMFQEILRVLRLGGRYICVSLAQKHVLQKVLRYFSEHDCMVRVCRVLDTKEEENKEFYMPVFVYVITKFKKMPNFKPILEVSCFEDQIERCESIEQIEESVLAMQYYGTVRQQLKTNSTVEEHVSVDLFSSASATPRYTLHIVDNQRKFGNKFAIFIVPEGRETEWLFSTDEGRNQLSESARFERLVVVTLHPDHQYGDLDQVKAELSTKVMELAPPKLGKSQVPFLSVGDDINQRVIKYRGESIQSGKFIVEEVKVDRDPVRRLVFLNNRHIVQSEVRLTTECVRKKGHNKKKTHEIVDNSYLCSQHHRAMVAGLAFIDNFKNMIEERLDICLVGLGGGCLANFIHTHFPKVYLDAVELDSAIVTVAKNWFGCVPDDRLQVHNIDGLQYINQLSEQGVRLHAVLIDVDNKDMSLGMTSPPPEFITSEMITNYNAILHPQGVFIINLSCRDSTLREDVLKRLKSVFKCIYLQKVPEQVNEIVIALPGTNEMNNMVLSGKYLPRELELSVKALQDTANSQKKEQSKPLHLLVKSLEGLSLL